MAKMQRIVRIKKDRKMKIKPTNGDVFGYVFILSRAHKPRLRFIFSVP